MFIDFKKQTVPGDILMDWWKSLDMVEVLSPAETLPAGATGTNAETGAGADAPLKRGDRAGRAALRRADRIAVVVMTPVYQRLFRRLCQAGWPHDNDSSNDWRNDRLAAVAGLLAHVAADDSDRSLPLAMSRREKAAADSDSADGDRPPVSPLRFKRLLESPDMETLFTGLRRTLPLLKQGGGIRVDVRGLATDVVNWGDSVKKRWAYGYVAWGDKPDG